ncbi:hypothetical protein NLG97_g5416 [Lecanicillium saksenae]|uniref:Uncharacterized protein n=1 Tax=Lecanicillium saksenae TaxID=468837 RepID=A0ACC1QUX8_9HYPO|nr:hypothetical protein NLG97_g5416 [Lecanicillium saksenae]
MDYEIIASLDRCPSYASFFGAMGCAFAIVCATFGAAYGTAKPAAGIFASGILRPERLMPNTLCAVMAQILSIYGLVCCVVMIPSIQEKMAIHTAFLQLGGGIAVGLCSLAAGFSIGIVGDAGVRASSQQPRLYMGMVLILIFSEVLGLYGFVVSLLMITKSKSDVTQCKF